MKFKRKRLPAPPPPIRSDKVRDITYEVFGDAEAAHYLTRETTSARACNPPRLLHRVRMEFVDGRTVTYKWHGAMSVEVTT